MVRWRIRKNLEFSPRASVCLFARPFVCNPFSQNPFITFSENFQLELVNAEKIFQALFWEKSLFTHFGRKLHQNNQKCRFFTFLSKSIHYNFQIIFCTKPTVVTGVEKRCFRIFRENPKMAHFGQMWPFGPKTEVFAFSSKSVN